LLNLKECRVPTCFVVMGFGEKTDYQSNPQRVLNLNRTYEDIIEPAVTAAGLECIRADKIIHSTVIDKPMYEHLLNADLVIADLSTSNANAIYELGVRHALRPHTTIVLAEDKFAFPFDLNHVSITKYEHLGKEIGYREVMRMRGELQQKISVILHSRETDSPVYLFLPQLLGRSRGAAVPEPAPTAAPRDEKSLADLVESLNDAKRAVKQPADWLVVAALARRLQNLQPHDAYIVQQLALATYKSKHPDVLGALQNARAILETLKPDTSSDAETVGLWGAIHKRLWEVGGERGDLDKAIRSYARGYFIRDDHYNGINFAFLLNVRAALAEGDDATADRVLARRIRAEVLTLCDTALATVGSAAAAGTGDDLFWLTATKVEALLGLGRKEEADALREQLIGATPKPAEWMVSSMSDQLEALAKLRP
jgi:tetratricopeptide (TPR) repeat protein